MIHTVEVLQFVTAHLELCRGAHVMCKRSGPDHVSS